MPEFPLPFVKMSGTGNDFILIDNRRGLVRPDEMAPLAAAVCHRQNGVGADGLILIQEDPELDFAWRFFNADGSEPAMCGNGSRCAARFAFLEGIAKEKMVFRTLAGPISAEVKGSTVKVQLTPAHGLEPRFTLEVEGRGWDAGFVNTGVPHAVLLVPPGELDRLRVDELGRKVRFHPRFGAAGTNANFVEVVDRRQLRVRTYERGVEGETLACGTGAVASALVLAARGEVDAPVTVITRGGENLRVHLENRPPQADPAGGALRLEGAARLICRGHLMEEGVSR